MTGETAGSCVDHAPTDLLDLDWKDTGQRCQKHANEADTSTRNVDLFDDIFVEKNPAAQPENAVEEQTQTHASFKAFEKGGLTLTMALSKDPVSYTHLTLPTKA